jgi:hypothetical protein
MSAPDTAQKWQSAGLGFLFLTLDSCKCSRPVYVDNGLPLADAHEYVVDIVTALDDLAAMDCSAREESVIALTNFERLFAVGTP